MIKNISSLFKIKDFKFRFFNTIIFISVFRFGTFLVLPGVDSSMLKPYKDGILGILDTFLGGAFSNASIFGLGILPYISASIAVQLLTILFPKFQRIKMEGYSGRKKLNKLTKILTFGIAFFQSFPYLFSIISKGIVFVDTFYFLFYSTIFLVSGTMFCVWLGDRITDKGIGNGSSVLIAVGIVSSLPSAIYSEHLLLKDKKLSYYFIEFLALYLITAFIVGFTKAVRKINVVFAKNFELESYKYQKKQNISFKLNDTGIMPVIFAQTMMFIPAFITNTISSKNSFTSFLKKSFMDNNSWQYNLIFSFLIIIFTYFYTAITINPENIASDMKKQNSFIPGISSGKKTADFLDKILSNLILPSSLILAFIAVIPVFAKHFGVNSSFSKFFGGTSMIILVGSILEIIQQVNSFSLLSKYDFIDKKSIFKKI